MAATGADTIRILVATDNHVGYCERDPIRRDDSWRTFDEIMRIARKQDVDMVLLSGDLFHDNKPSRKSMYQVMRSLRQNCLGMKPCELEFLCDAAEVFEGAFGHVNYEDPDMNISIPVFSIHGNHDDPSGDGHYCSLDLLQVAGLVNYFGRVPEADNIEVKPVLMQKGRTKLSLFGLSNVRDERMHRTFRDNKVKFFRANQSKDDWFNLLAVHQNHHAHTATGYLPENFLPDWMDLVVWGHEHECLIDPIQNPETGFQVIQPGSSVATSLVPGEAVPKHVAVLSITGKQFTVDKVPLKTIRPFVIKEIVMTQDPRFKRLLKEKENRAAVTKGLMKIVDEMIEQASEEWHELQTQGADDDEDGVALPEQPLPLIRLKVEHSAPEGVQFEIENPQRFSNRFAGRVANTNDVVYFHRKKGNGASSSKTKGTYTAPDITGDDGTLDILKVEELVGEYLSAQSVKILPHKQMGEAVNQFVSKDNKRAMQEVVMDSLQSQLDGMLKLETDEKNVDAVMAELFEKQAAKFVAGEHAARKIRYKPRPDGWDSDVEGRWEARPEAVETDREEEQPQAPARPRATARGRGRAAQPADEVDDMSLDDWGDDTPQPAKAAPPPQRAAAPRARKAAPAKKAPAKQKTAKQPARGGGRKKAFVESEDSDQDMIVDENEDKDEDDDEEDDFEEVAEPPPPPKPKKGAATTTAKRSAPARVSARATKQTTLNFSQSQRPARSTQKTALELSADEISEEDDFESMSVTRSRRR